MNKQAVTNLRSRRYSDSDVLEFQASRVVTVNVKRSRLPFIRVSRAPMIPLDFFMMDGGDAIARAAVRVTLAVHLEMQFEILERALLFQVGPVRVIDRKRFSHCPVAVLACRFPGIPVLALEERPRVTPASWRIARERISDHRCGGRW